MTKKKFSKGYPYIILFKIISTFDYKGGTIRFSSSIPKRMTINEISNIVAVKRADFNEILKILESLGLVKVIKINNREKYLDISQKLITQIERGNEIRKTLRKMEIIPKSKDLRMINKSIKSGK